MPCKVLGDSLHLRLGRLLLATESTAKACGSLFLFEDGLHLLAIFRNDGLLTLEVFSVEVLT